MTVLWRSLQYVPAHVEKYVTSDRILDADAVILDLQDSVPATAKVQARQGAASAAQAIASRGQDVLVRINEGETGLADIDAVVGASVSALVIPQVRSAIQVRLLDQYLSAAEAARGVPAGSTGLLLLIESAEGLVRMTAAAKASARVRAMNLGNEDLALDLGVAPEEASLTLPRQLMVIAASAAGVEPLGLAGSGSDYSDLEAYRARAERSRRMGSRGSSCIHPSQIAVLNEVFSPTETERDWAGRVLDTAATGDPNRGAFAVDGQMVDAPILARAREILARHEAIRNRLRSRAALSA